MSSIVNCTTVRQITNIKMPVQHGRMEIFMTKKTCLTIVILVIIISVLFGCAPKPQPEAFKFDYSTDISMTKYRHGHPRQTVTLSVSDKSAQEEMVMIFENMNYADRKTNSDTPDVNAYILVEFSPENIYSVYKIDERFYAEKARISVQEMSSDAYYAILLYFGNISDDPETLDKTEFLAPIQQTLADYAAGIFPETDSTPKFSPFPPNTTLPAVNSIDDFLLDEGYGECLYTALINLEQDNTMIFMFGRYDGPDGWPVMRVLGVRFE